jgi:diguanylate cyclase (GGDEF)-like protein
LSAETTKSFRLGILGRLAVFTTSAVILVLSLGGLSLDQVEQVRSQDEFRRKSAGLLASLAVPCAISVALDNLEELDTLLAEVTRVGSEHLGILHVAMLDNDGRVLTHAPSKPKITIDDVFFIRAARSSKPLWRRYEADDGQWVLQISMPSVSGIRWGTLVAHFSLAEPLDRIDTIRKENFLMALVAAIVSLLVMIFGLWRIVIRPVSSLAKTARKIRKGDMGARSALGSNDELGDLGRVFNAMAAELQSYTEGLEQKVTERTRELNEKNEQLIELNVELQAANKKLDQMARTDPLTGLFNRGHFSEVFAQEIARAGRTDLPFSVLICDVDHFKLVNDDYGHQTGDAVLQQLSKILTGQFRSTDIVARFGGEEFVVLLPNTDRETTLHLAETLREVVAGNAFTDPSREVIRAVTLSIGAASYPDDGLDPDSLLSHADQALYQAKTDGRDKVVIWESTRQEADSEPKS